MLKLKVWSKIKIQKSCYLVMLIGKTIAYKTILRRSWSSPLAPQFNMPWATTVHDWFQCQLPCMEKERAEEQSILQNTVCSIENKEINKILNLQVIKAIIYFCFNWKWIKNLEQNELLPCMEKERAEEQSIFTKYCSIKSRHFIVCI